LVSSRAANPFPFAKVNYVVVHLVVFRVVRREPRMKLLGGIVVGTVVGVETMLRVSGPNGVTFLPSDYSQCDPQSFP
jgi:hypothetical protein